MFACPRGSAVPVFVADRSLGDGFVFPIAANPWARLRLPASLGLPGFSGLNVVNRLCVNVYKYIFCMYAFPNDLEKIDVIFIYCSGCFVSILYF